MLADLLRKVTLAFENADFDTPRLVTHRPRATSPSPAPAWHLERGDRSNHCYYFQPETRNRSTGIGRDEYGAAAPAMISNQGACQWPAL